MSRLGAVNPGAPTMRSPSLPPEDAQNGDGATLALPEDMRALFGGVDQLSSLLTYHRERHTRLASNVANLDTPGYKPTDLVRTPGAGAGAIAKTAEGHLDPGGAPAGTEVVLDGAATAGRDGNAVSLERELAKIEENRLRYSTSAELVSRKLALLKYGASGGTT